MTNIPTNYLSFLPLVSRIGNDARILPTGAIDFSLDTDFQIDLTATIQSAQLQHPIQSAYIDASQIPFDNVQMQVFGSGQQITIAPRTQGYYPLLLTANSFIFTFRNGSCRNQGVIAPLYVFFLNIPFVASQWNTFNQYSGGYGVGGFGTTQLGN